MDSSDNAPVIKWRCTKCGEEKPLTLEYFYHSPKTKRGFQSWCKTCQKAQNQTESSRQYIRDYQKRPEVKERVRARASTPESIARKKAYWQRPEVKAKQRERWRIAREQRPRAEPKITEPKPTKPSSEKKNGGYYYYPEKSAEYYRQHKEEFARKGKEYREKNKERLRERARERYSANREQWIAKTKEWQRANPDKKKAQKHRRNARKRDLPFNWTDKHWQVCLEYWHYCCAICGAQLRDLFGKVAPNADHWIPLSYKGADNPGTVVTNMICLCPSCNFSKHDDLPADWINRKYGKRKATEILTRVAAYFEYMKGQAHS